MSNKYNKDRNIRDLTLCMTLLHKFPNLTQLSVHGNQLKMLPMMSELKLITLDVTNNPL
jgi:Leucine-rich repeat (LRR) protein